MRYFVTIDTDLGTKRITNFSDNGVMVKANPTLTEYYFKVNGIHFNFNESQGSRDLTERGLITLIELIQKTSFKYEIYCYNQTDVEYKLMPVKLKETIHNVCKPNLSKFFKYVLYKMMTTETGRERTYFVDLRGIPERNVITMEFSDNIIGYDQKYGNILAFDLEEYSLLSMKYGVSGTDLSPFLKIDK